MAVCSPLYFKDIRSQTVAPANADLASSWRSASELMHPGKDRFLKIVLKKENTETSISIKPRRGLDPNILLDMILMQV